jgi:hypothetical protein
VIFKGLNRDRIYYLVLEVAGSARLKSFLDDSRIKLTAVGAQYHKRRRGVQADFDFLVHLPAAAEGAVKAWLASLCPAKPALLPEALIAQLRAVESQRIALPKEQRHEFAQQGLAYLVADPPVPSWLEFLSTSVGGSEAGSDKDSPPKPPLDDPRRTLDAIADSLFEKGLSGAANDLERLIAGFIFLESGDVSAASESAQAMRHNGAKGKLLAAIARRVEATVKSLHQVRRPTDLPPDTDLSIDQVELIGICRPRNSEESPAFIKVVAFRFEDSLYTLDDERRSRWLDDQPEIIGFSNVRSLRLPRTSALGAWVAERFTTSQPIKNRVKRNGTAIYSVMPLHADPQRPDAIREAIGQTKMAIGIRSIFLLADGSFIRFANEVTNSQDHDFEEPLELFRDLQCWDIAGTQIVLGPLPSPDDWIDCSDITSVLKRLLKSKHAQVHIPKMTQAQIASFMDALRDDPGTLTAARLERVKNSLTEIARSGEKLSQLLPMLMASPEIQAEIVGEKKVIIDAFVGEQSVLREDRDKIKKEILELQRRRAAVEQEIKQTGTEIRKTVKKAFERAKAAGVGTLGDVAVLSGIMGVSRDNDSPSTDLPIRQLPPSRRGLSKAFGNLGAPMVHAKAAELFVGLVLASRVPLVLVGPLASQYALAIAQETATDKVVAVDIPIGLMKSSAIEAVMIEIGPGDALIIANANAAPYEAYGSAITERILANLSPAGGTGTHIIFAMLPPPVGLPLALDLQGVTLTFDTRWLMSEDPSTDRLPVVERAEHGEFENLLLKNALADVITQVTALEEPFHSVVNSFLMRQRRPKGQHVTPPARVT